MGIERLASALNGFISFIFALNCLKFSQNSSMLVASIPFLEKKSVNFRGNGSFQFFDHGNFLALDVYQP